MSVFPDGRVEPLVRDSLSRSIVYESSVARDHTDSRVGPGPYIPTKGYPTSALDWFSVQRIIQTGHDGWNSCYTDVDTCNGLATLIEGEVTRWEQIEAAELALQLFMWHDRVDVLIPSVSHRTGQHTSYQRFDVGRSKLAYDLFQPLQAQDEMFVAEEIASDAGIVVASNVPGSPIIGRSISSLAGNYLGISNVQSRVLSSIPLQMKVPGYFSDPLLIRHLDKRGHFGILYDSMRQQWDDAGEAMPQFEQQVHLPPLVSIVLDRASSRSGLPEVILELREELAIARAEMLELDTFTGRMFRQLLATSSMHSLLSTHFSQAEIDNLNRPVRS